MKTLFNKEYILANKGCYSEEQIEQLPFDKDDNITLLPKLLHIAWRAQYFPIKTFIIKHFRECCSLI